MHHLLNFLTKVEVKIDAADGVETRDAQGRIIEQNQISILDVWEPLKDFLIQFIFASSTPLDIIDPSIKVNASGAGDMKTETATIDVGDIKLCFDSNDLYIYYGFMQLLRKKQFTGKLLHFYFLGEERTVTTKVNIAKLEQIDVGEIEPTLDGRSINGKNFIENAISAIKDDCIETITGDYELKSIQKIVYLIKAYIGQEKSIDHLFNFPPALTKHNEIKKELKDDNLLEDGFLIHHAEFRVPGINFFNLGDENKYYALNEVIRSFIVNYGIAFGSYDALTKCFNCGRVILPQKKSHRSFCSQKCRSLNHKIELGEKKFACLDRQRKWFAYNLFKDFEEAKTHYEEGTITIPTNECKICERYWDVGKIPGGICDVFVKKYGIENPKKNEWIEEEMLKLAEKTVDEEKVFAEEVAKLMAKK